MLATYALAFALGIFGDATLVAIISKVDLLWQ
jgi:hypothetical protein